MKKSFLIILTIIIVLLCLIYYKYTEYKSKNNEIKKFNSDFEFFLNKEVTGIELTSCINRAVDNNEKNKIPKDENGFYLQNDENSIFIEIKITDLEEEKNLKMEQFYQKNMVTFLSYYDNIKFKCTEIKYNSHKKVSFMLFEQISN